MTATEGTPGRRRSALGAEQGSAIAAGIAAALRSAGTEVLFGVPGGGSNLDVIGAAEAAGLRFVLGHGETATAIMASAYAELAGRPGAVVATRGPGAASLANGVAHALLDRVPLLAITDCVAETVAARTPHQLLDHGAIFGTLAKWSGRVGGAEPEEAAAAALALARAPRPGPVHIDLDPTAAPAAPPRPRPSATADPAALQRARALLEHSRRPLLLAGVGARAFAEQLRDAVRNTNVPVLATYKAKGVVPESWPNAGPLFTGAQAEAPLLAAADLVVAVGFDAVEAIPGTFVASAPLLSLAEWPEGSAYARPDVELVAPLADTLAELLPLLRDDWEPARAQDERRRHLEALGPADEALGPAAVVRTVRAAAPSRTVATVDAGAHMLAAMPLWQAEHVDETLTSSGLATMGYALPAAIGAAVALPDRVVVCFTGDGGLGMALAELETLARLRLRVVVVVLNDAALTLIELKQRANGHGGSNAVRYLETDFAAVAAAVGIRSSLVDDPAALGAALRGAFERDGPTLIDARIDPSSYRAILAATRGA